MQTYEELRALTPGEERDAEALDPPLGPWYSTWIDSGWSREEIAEWYPVTRSLTKLPTWAARLRAHNLTPTIVAAALNDPLGQIVLASVTVQAAADRTELDAAARAAVLCQFVYAVIDSLAGGIADQRAVLTRKLRNSGMTDVDVAVLLGLTKQRVGAIRKRGWGTPKDRRE